MDGVPYPQPLTGHEPQYVPWGVPRVRPIGHPPGPVPPWAASLRSQPYPALLLLLRWGRYGHRGGKGTSDKFYRLPHADFKNAIYFSRMTNTLTQASGCIWNRTVQISTPFWETKNGLTS